jgi:spore coat-associated protein N
MGIKKKLGLGLASAALGLSLVGGGTFAYFSDEATVHNGFASGTLNLEVGSYPGTKWPVNFDLQNLRPGDTVLRTFDLKNVGSLAIEDTYLSFAKVAVENPLHTGATDDDFLSALQVNYFVETVVNGEYVPQSIVKAPITLNDAIAGKYTGKIQDKFLKADGTLNLTPDGINAGKNGRYMIAISFPDTEVAQNKLQGMVAKVDFKLDARQVVGNKEYDSLNPNGKITGNELQGTGTEYKDSDKAKYKVTPDGNGLVNPDINDNPAWEDTGK